MRAQIGDPPAATREFDFGRMNFIAVGDNHQLVVGRHAEIFDVHHLRIFTLQLQLQRFNITIAANDRVNLAGQQGAGQLEIDVNQLDALRIDIACCAMVASVACSIPLTE
jgi:hypothetical protein